MTFNVSADAYGQYMGRYSEPLAVPFAKAADVRAGQQALDVGCGPGALTAVLVGLLGAEAVSAIEPSPPFVAAVAARLPGVDVTAGSAEDLPYADASFDRTLAQLVVHFMADPVAGLREMARVTKPGGMVAASVWDHAGGGSPLSVFWSAVHDIDPHAHDEANLAGARRGHLVELCEQAGMGQAVEQVLTVHVHYATFDEWWHPYTLGVGPGGALVKGWDATQREALQARCAERLPPAPFDIAATAWCAVATIPGR